jgi:hypothetical protein
MEASLQFKLYLGTFLLGVAGKVKKALATMVGYSLRFVKIT